METIEKRLLSGRADAALSRRVLPPLLASDTIPATAEVLHIGCGTGQVTHTLARAFPQWRITVLDSDAALLATAFHRLGGPEGIRVTRAAPPQLP